MSCPRCQSETLATTVGHVCLECGFYDGPERPRTRVKRHRDLVHNEKRLAVPTEPGDGKVDQITDHTAFTAESNATYGAFTWVQVAIGRFSSYAVVFVLIIVLGGLSYGYFARDTGQRAGSPCEREQADLTQTSSEPASAGMDPTPTATPCPVQ